MQKLVADAQVRSTEIPAQYESRTYQKMVADASSVSNPIDVKYSTRSYAKMVSNAKTSEVTIPAQYVSRSIEQLASPATTTTSEVPAVYKTITKRKLVKKGGYSELREIVCENDLTTDLVLRVQNALIARGFDLGAAGADNDMGPSTKAALRKFQLDNNLPIGQLDYETLEALGIKR
jgi:hypothetical protein